MEHSTAAFNAQRRSKHPLENHNRAKRTASKIAGETAALDKLCRQLAADWDVPLPVPEHSLHQGALLLQPEVLVKGMVAGACEG